MEVEQDVLSEQPELLSQQLSEVAHHPRTVVSQMCQKAHSFQSLESYQPLHLLLSVVTTSLTGFAVLFISHLTSRWDRDTKKHISC